MSWIDDAMQQMQQWLTPAQPTPMPQPSWEAAPAVQEGPIPFHPSEKSLRQAPEKSLTAEHISTIAKARRLAEEKGVLTPELGDHLLPMAMTEGWGPTMGVRTDNAFYASPRFKKSLEHMGMQDEKDYFTTYIRGEPHVIPRPNSANGPSWAAAILGEKAKLQGVRTPEDAVKRYNGKGKAMENADGELVPADVDVYWKKVQEARRLLTHEKNAPFYEHYMKAYGGER